MQDISSNACALLQRWLPAARRHFHTPPEYPALQCYGTGESYHWAVQTNANVFAALAALSVSPTLDEGAIAMSRSALQDTALRLLRYTLHTHKCAEALCTNGQQWGQSWISGLSLERMRHGIDALQSRLTENDRRALHQVMVAEANYLLDDYPVQAGPGFYENRPESNIWNGSLLLRTAMDYPDTPRKNEYLEKATKFFVNGISIPSDASSQRRFNGKSVQELFVGANFTQNFSLNHNGYQNMGYAALALSNVGFLHFSAKRHGWSLPPEIYFHVQELWDVLKHFFFQDGRFIRIGGDDRVRYCYCQDYAVPAWLFIWDYLGDPMALQFEERWQKIITHEAMLNPDGAFLSGRLQQMALDSPFYYTRLEGDRAVSASYGMYWRNAGLLRNAIPVPPQNTSDQDTFSWQDETHGATLDKNPVRICSMTWDAAARPVALCVPAQRSDMAEWQNNLSGIIMTSSLSEATMHRDQHALFPGGFVNSGAVLWTEKTPFGEGEQEAVYARQGVALAALPDGASAICLQHATTTRRIYLRRIQGMGYRMPNDLFNGNTRCYTSAEGQLLLHGHPAKEEIIHLNTDWLTVDNLLSFVRIYGGDGMTIFRPDAPQARVMGFPHTSLYSDELCTQFDILDSFVSKGMTVLDTGVMLVTGSASVQAAALAHSVKFLELGNALRGVQAVGLDGLRYTFVANFSNEGQPVPVELRQRIPLHAKCPLETLPPYAAYLYNER